MPALLFSSPNLRSAPARTARFEQPFANAPGSKRAFDQRLMTHGLHEVLGETASSHPAALAFILAAVSSLLRETPKPLLAIALKAEAQEQGRLHGVGLSAFGIDAAQVIAATARTEKELLWAAEEGAGCVGLGAVVAVMGRRERLYGFKASLRLKLRSQRARLPVFILRPLQIETTAATARWRVRSLPSEGPPIPGSSQPLLGAPRLSVRLERYAGLPPQTWELEIDAKSGLSAIEQPLSNSSILDANGVRLTNSA